jgi:hypothetical protein
MESLIILLISSVCLVATGCVDQQATRAEGCAAGTAVGAGIGYALGALGVKDRRTAVGIGAGMGLLGGCLAGDQVARYKQQQVSREQALDSQIAYWQDYVDKARQYNASMAKTIAALRVRLATTETSYKRGIIQKNTLETQRQNVLRVRNASLHATRAMSAKLGEAQRELENLWKTGAGAQKVSALMSEIADLQAEVARAQSNDTQMAEMQRRMF